MINGAHAIVYSTNPEADRAFLRDVLKLPNVDVGEGWLIFGLPPAEVAVHPSDENDVHELYFMCDDIEALVAAMTGASVACGPVLDRGWGLLSEVTLPGGGKLGVYQPRHPRPEPMGASQPAARKSAKRLAKAVKRPARKAAKKPAKAAKRKARKR